MVETTPGTASTALVFVNTESVNGMPGPPPPTYSSEVLTPSGAAKIGVSRNSAYDGPSGLSGYVLQITGPSSPKPRERLDQRDQSRNAGCGGLAVTPRGPRCQLGYGPFSCRTSNLIGAGSVGADGLAYDLSKDLIVPIIIANSNVAPF